MPVTYCIQWRAVLNDVLYSVTYCSQSKANSASVARKSENRKVAPLATLLYFISENYMQPSAAVLNASWCSTSSFLLCAALSEQKWVDQFSWRRNCKKSLLICGQTAGSRQWSKNKPICNCDVQSAGTVLRCTDGCASIRNNTELR